VRLLVSYETHEKRVRRTLRGSRRPGRAGLVSGLALSSLLALPARAVDESMLLDHPPARSVKEEAGPLDRGLEEEPEPEPAYFPEARQPFEDLPAFLRDTKLEIDFRSYWFRRRLTNGDDQEALTTGGILRYHSGWLIGHAQIGAALYSSQRLRGRDDRDGTGLLRTRQRSYTVLGEAFVRLRALDNELTGFRHRLNLPFLNGNDSRMTPNTFEGVSLRGRKSWLSYTGGHLFRFKRRNDNDFESFSEAAGVPGASANGLSFGGVQFEPVEGLTLGALDLYVKDTLNTAYTEAEWVSRTAPESWSMRIGSQFTHQRSVGDDRLTGESFDTWVWGAKLAGSWREMMLSVAVSVVDDEARIRNPWGSYPGYLSMMLRGFNRADQKSWGVGASGYLTALGLPQASLALRYSEGYQGKGVDGRSVGDERELNTTLDYRLTRGPLRGLWVRGRFGWGQTENQRKDTLEARIVLRYEFQAL
jgi:hypothetical protein